MLDNPEKRLGILFVLLIGALILIVGSLLVLHHNPILLALVFSLSLCSFLCSLILFLFGNYAEKCLVRQLDLGNYIKAFQYAKQLQFIFKKSLQSYIELLSLLKKIDSREIEHESAKEQLKNFFENKSEETACISLFQYGLLYDFETLLPWFEAKFPESATIPKSFLLIYIRTLFETGRIDTGIEIFSKWNNSVEGTATQNWIYRYTGLLFVFAFTGQQKQTAIVAKLILPQLESRQKLWQATAELAMGNYEAAEQIFNQLNVDAPNNLKSLIPRRLDDCHNRKPIPKPSSPEAVKALESLSEGYNLTTLAKQNRSNVNPVRRRIGFLLIIIGVIGIILTLQHPHRTHKVGSQATPSTLSVTHPNVNWSFPASEMALFNAAFKAEKATNEMFYHVTPPIEGYTYTVAEKDWNFSYQGQSYIAFSSDLRVKIATNDGAGETWVQTYEIFKPDGTYVTSVEQEIEDKKKFQVLVTSLQQGIQVHTFSWEKEQTQSTETTQRLPHLKYPYLENAAYAFSQKWMTIPLKQKIPFNYFSNESIALSNFDFEIKERKKWTPLAPWDIHYVVSKNGKQSSEVWLDSKKKLSTKISYGSTVLMPCSKEVLTTERAKPLSDTNENTSALNFWLLDTEHLQQLKLKFSLKNSEEKALFTENTRQTVESLPSDQTEIIVTLKANSPDSSGKAGYFYKDEISDALKSTRFHQSNDPAIIAIAHCIVQQEKNPSKQAVLLAKWVKENIRWTYAVLNGDARETLKNRIGDCSEHSALFVAMARTLKIPAQEVTGYRVTGTEIGSHAWAEIYDHGWKEIDPSDGKWISAAYLRMEHTILPAHIRKLQVVEVTYNGKTEKIDSTKPYWWYHNGHYYNRALGLLMQIPSYLSYHVERLYPKWLFQADSTDTHFPIAQGPVENALFCVTWIPTLDNWADLLKQPSLLLSDMFVSVYPHDPELYNLNKDLAPNAVFNAYRHVESWQERHGKYLFAVSKYRDNEGQQGLHYKIPLNNRIDIAFVIYGPFGAQKGHPKAPHAIIDLLHSTQSVKPDIEGKLSLKEDMTILNSTSK